MDREKIRQALMDAVIKIGAREGIHAITTRSVAEKSGINQYYLYRTFDSIDDVMFQANIVANKTFVSIALKHLAIYDDGVFTPEKEQLFFDGLWTDMKACSEMFTFYLRYYYNYVFPKDFSNEDVHHQMQLVLDKMKPLFKEGTDLRMMSVHLLEVMMRYTGLVHKGALPDNHETDKKVYQILFGSMLPFLNRTPFYLY